MVSNRRLLFADALRRITLFGCILLLTGLSSSPASAEVRVFPGEYVVELNTSRRNALTTTASADTLPGVVTRAVGRSAVLMVDSFRATLSTARESIPFNEADTFCAQLLLTGRATACSPNYEYTIAAVPNDPKLDNQWGLIGGAGINAPQGWDVRAGAEEIVVAVLDTGIDYTHPDLASNMWVNPGEIPGNGIDDDKNGYIDDVHGINALTASGDPFDDNSHGTHVAGTIGAAGNNGVGGSGVAWRVKLMGLKFLANSGAGSLAGAIAALDYAVMMKSRGVNIKVTNNSWGGGGYSQSLEAAIKRSTDAGILFVAAAGNEAKNIDLAPSYPASFTNPLILTVAAHDPDTNLANFSNYGSTSVDISAPGVGILSTIPGARYASYSGTSMASPHVAGLAAFAFQADPTLDAAGAIARITQSGRDAPAHNTLTVTRRLVDLGRLLTFQFVPVTPPTAPPAACSYDAVDIAFSPDSAADKGQLIIEADELSFTNVVLPFSFPFFGTTNSSITVSPNGVVYMGNSAPGTLDFKNSDRAPANSIAVLHTDLYPAGAPSGVRILTQPTHVTVYWHAKHYLDPQAGYVTAWLSLFADGRIVSSTGFSSETVRNLVAQSATIGITGINQGESVVVATGGAGITQRSIQYVRNCNGHQSGTVLSQLSLHALSRRGKSVKRLGAGKVFGVVLNGIGSGMVQAQVAFDGISCPQSANFSLVNGVGVFGSRLRKEHEYFRRVSVVAGGISQQLSIRRTRSFRSQRSSKRKLAQRACRKLSFSPLQ